MDNKSDIKGKSKIWFQNKNTNKTELDSKEEGKLNKKN